MGTNQHRVERRYQVGIAKLLLPLGMTGANELRMNEDRWYNLHRCEKYAGSQLS